jgi:cell wall-associated NlpC family hydrolase
MNYEKYLGTPFEFGGRGPDTYDCYGLIMAVLKERGVVIPDYTSPSDEAKIAGLFAGNLHLWEKCEKEPGAVVLINAPPH